MVDAVRFWICARGVRHLRRERANGGELCERHACYLPINFGTPVRNLLSSRPLRWGVLPEALALPIVPVLTVTGRAAWVWGNSHRRGGVREKNEDCVFARPLGLLGRRRNGWACGHERQVNHRERSSPSWRARDALERDDVAAADRVEPTGNHKLWGGSRETGHGNNSQWSGAPLPGWSRPLACLQHGLGDSRVYRYESEGIEAEDTRPLRSSGTRRRQPGRFSRMQARHRRSEKPTVPLGSDLAPDIDMWLLPMVQGERLIICSDGLVAEVSDRRITWSLGEIPGRRRRKHR